MSSVKRRTTRLAVLQCLLSAACAHVGEPRAPAAITETPPAVRLELPPSLESERDSYAREIEAARSRVVAWFAANRLTIGAQDIVDSAMVFADVPAAKRHMSKHFGIPEEKIPDGFSGTVDGKALFVVARETYAKTYARLYPEHPWSSDSYQSLITHELAHRAHAVKAQELFGSEEGMGPRWFFEGLAITCASQFSVRSLPTLTWEGMQELMAKDSTQQTMSYPRYGQMFRSIAASFPVAWLVQHAGRADFVALLQSDYLPTEFVLEQPTGTPSRGAVLLVHGSAPFNLDGRIPAPGVETRYAKTDFYKDLAASLRAAGWNVLRYSKPGVHKDSIDQAAYAKTDLALLSRQLRNLWRFLPAEGPRVVFAWSEGTLHVHALPMSEVSGVILLGGIATNIGDVVRAQGGPPAEVLKAELVGKDRHEMLGLDRPVGRFLDELALEENWRLFLPLERLPFLVLHGSADAEVPSGQAAVWKPNLKKHPITVIEGPGLDHRFMPQTGYDVVPVAREITRWLDATFPRTGT